MITIRKLLCLLLVLSCVCRAVADETPAPAETERVAAFGRLYGVVRYFHPSDAAQEIDWARFAAYGVGRARLASGPGDLQRELTALFAPITVGVEVVPTSENFMERPIPATGEPVVAWRHRGLGLGADSHSATYVSRRAHRQSIVAINGTTLLMQTVEAESLRGLTVRMRATVRSNAVDNQSGVALWMRVEKGARRKGVFDNVQDRRAIRDPQWREYELITTVDPDAQELAFGVMAWGAVVGGFDAVELAKQNEQGGWERIKIADAGFEKEPTLWKKSGTSTNAQIERQQTDAPQGRAWVRIQARPETTELFPASLRADRQVDFDLGAGLKARVPLALVDSAAKISPDLRQALGELKQQLGSMPDPTGAVSQLDVRQADVIVAWNVYRHFYPYWKEVAVDWDSRLAPLLDSVSQDDTRAMHLRSLRRLTGEVRDGQGYVLDTLDSTERAYLPIFIEPLDGAWGVGASAVPDQARVGDVIEAIDGVPTAEYVDRTRDALSGSPQWLTWRAATEFCSAPAGSKVTLSLRRGEELVQTALTYEAKGRPPQKRPEPVAELSPGVWYIDLTRAKLEMINPKLMQLAAAKAVIFDVRGYPSTAGNWILPHLLKVPEQARWMHVPQLIGPFGEQAGFADLGWNFKPQLPYFAGKRYFLADGRAIGYAESVLAYVADEKLGDIVGAPTAGTNGNVNVIDLPTGYRLIFTGLRVTRHDGSPFHLLGIRPTVQVQPTVEGLRADRDEVLQKALELAGSGS